MAEGDDRRFIRNPVADQIDPNELPNGGHLDKGLLHGWIAEEIPLLLQVDTQHGGHRIGRAAALLAGLWVVGLNQFDQRLPRDRGHHLGKKLFALGTFLGRGQLKVR